MTEELISALVRNKHILYGDRSRRKKVRRLVRRAEKLASRGGVINASRAR